MRNIRQLLVAFLMSAVVACGGGGTLGESGTPATPTFSLGLTLQDNAGTSSNALSLAKPLTLEAKITATNNGVISGQVVKFEIDDSSLATFSNATASAVTDDTGMARINLLVGTKAGAGTITATMPSGGTKTIAFVSAGDGFNFKIALKLTNAAGATVSKVSKDTPLTATATLTSSGAVVANKLLSFSLSDELLANFSNGAGTAQTNAAGIATIGLAVGTKSGAGLITATLATGEKAEITFESAGDGGAVTKPIGSIKLFADSLQLGSGNNNAVLLTALVRDPNNVLMKDVAVQFSADNLGELQVDSNLTGADGTATAKLKSLRELSLRDIQVNASAGNKVATPLTISVVGTSLDISAPNSVVIDSSTNLDIVLKDSIGNGIGNIPLSLTSKVGNKFSNAKPSTDISTGKVTVQYTATSTEDDEITVVALGATKKVAVKVNRDAFAFVDTAPISTIKEIDINPATEASTQVKVNWLSNRQPVVGSPVQFLTSRGVLVNAGKTPDYDLDVGPLEVTTDAAGDAVVYARAKHTGVSIIEASAKDPSGNLLGITSRKTIEFISTNPDAGKGVEVQLFPTQVGLGEKASVRAILRDKDNNPVKNQRVAFSLANAAGGRISPLEAITNSQGVATTEFEADLTTGANTSTNLNVSAFVVTKPSVKGSSPVAVGKKTLFFRFGTGNAISKGDLSRYIKEFSIMVTDGSGNPVPGQKLNVAAVPVAYSHGYWEAFPPTGSFKYWVAIVTKTCANEDINLNGILDPAEDANGDKELTPGNRAIVPTTVTANANGIATFNVEYPQDTAPWMTVKLIVSGLAEGTENTASRDYVLAVSSDDTTKENVKPVDNAFGLDGLCTEYVAP